MIIAWPAHDDHVTAGGPKHHSACSGALPTLNLARWRQQHGDCHVRRHGVLVGDVPAGDSHAPLGPYDTRCASQLQEPSCSSAHTAWGSDCGDAATMTKGRMTTWRGSRPTGAGDLMQRCQVATTSRRPSSWAVADAGAPEHVRWVMACRRDGDDVLQRVAFEESSSKTSALHTA